MESCIDQFIKLRLHLFNLHNDIVTLSSYLAPALYAKVIDEIHSAIYNLTRVMDALERGERLEIYYQRTLQAAQHCKQVYRYLSGAYLSAETPFIDRLRNLSLSPRLELLQSLIRLQAKRYRKLIQLNGTTDEIAN